MRSAALFLALVALWLCCLQLVFARDRSTLIEPLTRGQLAVWSTPHAQDTLRRNNPEWDLMGRTFAVLSFANLALSQPQHRAQFTTAIDRIVDDTLTMEAQHGQTYFLLPYADASRRSLAVDGEVALMLAVRQFLERGDPASLRQRIATVEASLRASPLLFAESYPDEGWVFCNSVALAALRVSDAALGSDHSSLIADWSSSARHTLVDPKSHLLISSFHMNGEPRDGPEGLAGARADVSVLSGTMPSTPGDTLLGLGYALTYFATLFFAPPLFFAGLANHFFKNRSAAARNASGDSR